MDTAACEYCRVQRAVVYCQPDSARLCLACDAHVHAANALALRHPRALICDRCLGQPAITWCMDDGVLLCQHCDWVGGPSFPCSSLHRRQPVSSYSGCPSSSELLNLWSSVLNVNHLGNVPRQFPCSSDHAFDVYPLNFDHSLYPFAAVAADSTNTYHFMEGVLDNVDQGGMVVNVSDSIKNNNTSVSISNHTGESSAVDYQDSGVSPMLLGINESSPWDSNLDANYPQARNEAMMRYNEKKKSRSFGKIMKSASRKVKSDSTRTLIKGRVMKACDA